MQQIADNSHKINRDSIHKLEQRTKSSWELVLKKARELPNDRYSKERFWWVLVGMPDP